MASWRAAKTQQLQKQYAQRVRALRALRAPYGAKPRAISLKESLKHRICETVVVAPVHG
jgi:hypothetical protein